MNSSSTWLKLSRWRWEKDPLGYPFGGQGLELRTEDMAKLGMLFLNRGRWGEQRVIILGDNYPTSIFADGFESGDSAAWSSIGP